MATPWAIALVAPNSERHVAYMLDRYRFPFHVFWERMRCVYRGKVKERTRPLFSRYAFIKPENIFDIRNCVSAVYSALAFGDQLALVAHPTVQALCDVADQNDVLPYIEPSNKFHDGTQIIVMGDGPLCDRHGTYRKALRHGRALIMVDMFGQMVPAEVDETELSTLSQQQRMRRQDRRRRRHRHTH
jgi:hypothetical protein